MITLLPFCYNFINTLLNIGTGWWNGSWNPAILGGYLLYSHWLLGFQAGIQQKGAYAFIFRWSTHVCVSLVRNLLSVYQRRS